MKYTSNLKLKKPDGTDVVNIDDLNDNTDKVDKEIKKSQDNIISVNAKIGDISKFDKVTYANLKDIVNNNSLVEGQRYLLTDYRTKYQQPTSNIIKTMQVEQLVLTASSYNTFQPIAFSPSYPNDIIFYSFIRDTCEDGSTKRNGFITYRIDTYNSLYCPQDWRTMLWYRSDGEYKTFGDNCHDNYIGTTIRLHNNVFGKNFNSNTFGNNCNSNTFGNNCYNNTFGNYCYNNTFGYSCDSNSIGNGCYNNTFGDNCNHNIFGNNCGRNTFIDNCDNNSCGSSFYSNTFGRFFRSNSFGNDCRSNTFGDSCYYNSFGNDCRSNTFGNDCDYNSFENDCSSNTFGKNFYNLFIKKLNNKDVSNILDLKAKARITNIERNSSGDYIYWYFDSSNDIVTHVIP